ncbi:MAG TPA: hypothetical protein VJ521_08180, partial [Acidobacteriota bacterium]|nr:hypothetical protein [Acidobacteriota bacterium]
YHRYREDRPAHRATCEVGQPASIVPCIGARSTARPTALPGFAGARFADTDLCFVGVNILTACGTGATLALSVFHVIALLASHCMITTPPQYSA